MLKTVAETIEAFSMLAFGDHVLAAVSGGPDSVALLRALVILSPRYGLRLTTAHLNHGLRGEEADREEAFVRRLSDEMQIPCITRKIDVPVLKAGTGRSLEEVCREARYRFLEETARRCGAARIATGHHRDDQAETVLLNLIRGSGPEGLKGIVPVRDSMIIRPLLRVSRRGILDFLAREGLACMTDSSNASPRFLRNRIRSRLIPELSAAYNPKIVENLCRTAEIMAEEDGYLAAEVARILDGWGVAPGKKESLVPLEAFLGLHPALQGRIVKRLLESSVPSGQGIGYRHIKAVLALSRQDAGRGAASLDLPAGIRVERLEGTLRVAGGEGRAHGRGSGRAAARPEGFSYPVEVPGTVWVRELDRTVRFEFVERPADDEMRQQPQAAFIDFDRIFPPMTLRSLQPGDRMSPLGMRGTKKMQDYFVDSKTPRGLRRRIPLLVDGRSVVWIAGGRISERVRVTGETKRVLKAEMI